MNSVKEKKLVYCETMVRLCESEVRRWMKVHDQLSQMHGSSIITPSHIFPVNPKGNLADAPPVAAPNVDPRPAEVPNAVPPPAAVPEVPERIRLRMRMAHVIRGFIFIFALGLPKLFYYIYGVYSVFVLSGMLDHLQSVQFRQYWTGARPNLDIQLARLRERREALEKVSELELARLASIALGVEFPDEPELEREREFVAQFKPVQPWLARFAYQLIVMFFYTLFPGCHPHTQYMT